MERRHDIHTIYAGKSPLLGSPWPYLMHKRHKDPPAEHAGPTSVPEGREQDDNTEVHPCALHDTAYAPAFLTLPASNLLACLRQAGLLLPSNRTFLSDVGVAGSPEDAYWVNLRVFNTLVYLSHKAIHI